MTGQSRSELRSRLRSVATGNYLVLYEPSTNGIEVVRILHGSRDIARELRGG